MNFEHAITVLLSEESDRDHVREATQVLRGMERAKWLAEKQRDNLLAVIFRDGGQKQDAFESRTVACDEAHRTVAEAYGKLDELKKVGGDASKALWFLASLAMDHEPGCAVKDGNGDPCNCEVLIPEQDEKRKEIRDVMYRLTRSLAENT